ncbi:MDR family MFS transporter [Gulosibacter molinativorax]|uniref:MFS transporter n=1 Tax=Gulosibacter molinativorax TaxID=256821 RepID=A0ABT7C8Z9_9MICO|nr:MDR family MFS transporter [Gulosibacter molinativorax]MDJ1371662.1 MFS transporter [Gulosibacter molinativorax]QUY63084.1 Putative lincomycin resistance protein [Gulosibacter molinativorax]
MTKTEQNSATSAAPVYSTGRLVAIIGTLAIAAFVMILNETVLTVALPSLMSDFSISAASAGWFTTAFLLTMAICIPLTGYLMQRFGTRTLFLWAIALFAVGTLIAALATSFETMLLARIVQALGTAVIMPLLMTTSLRLIPAQHRGSIMGLNSVVISVGPAVGPTVAGLVIEAWSWHALFWGMLAFAVVAFFVGVLALPGGKGQPAGRLDAVSILLSVIGFGGFVYGVSSISLIGEGNYVPLIALVVGIAALWIFVVRQNSLVRSGGAPLLNLTPFKNGTFSRSLIIIGIAFGTMLGSTVVLPIYLENGLGLNTATVGLSLLAGGLIQAVISPIAGRIYDKHGPKPLVIPGTFLLAIGQWGLATSGADTALWTVIMFHTIFGAGMALVMSSMMTHSLGSLPSELYGHGSAIVNTLQQLAGAVGTALFLTAFGIGQSIFGTVEDAVRLPFIVGGVLAVVAIILSFTIKSAKREPEVVESTTRAPERTETGMVSTSA